MDTEYVTLSKQILDGCLSTKPGQRVWINSWDHTLELASDLAWNPRNWSRGASDGSPGRPLVALYDRSSTGAP